MMTTSVNDKNKIEIAATLKRLTTLSSYYFDIRLIDNIHHYYYYSIVLELLIHLNDLMQKLKNVNEEIELNDDMPATSSCRNITELVNFFRNVGCHNTKKERYNTKGHLFSNNVFAAYPPHLDDITILTGDEYILVKGHILKAYEIILLRFSNHPLLIEIEDYKWAVLYAKAQGININ